MIDGLRTLPSFLFGFLGLCCVFFFFWSVTIERSSDPNYSSVLCKIISHCDIYIKKKPWREEFSKTFGPNQNITNPKFQIPLFCCQPHKEEVLRLRRNRSEDKWVTQPAELVHAQGRSYLRGPPAAICFSRVACSWSLAYRACCGPALLNVGSAPMVFNCLGF